MGSNEVEVTWKADVERPNSWQWAKHINCRYADLFLQALAQNMFVAQTFSNKLEFVLLVCLVGWLLFLFLFVLFLNENRIFVSKICDTHCVPAPHALF